MDSTSFFGTVRALATKIFRTTRRYIDINGFTVTQVVRTEPVPVTCDEDKSRTVVEAIERRRSDKRFDLCQ